MLKIEVRPFFYDLIHCKDKILMSFSEWDKKYADDERGSLIAGLQESSPRDLVAFLSTVQRLAAGYEDIQEMVRAAEQAQAESYLTEAEDDE